MYESHHINKHKSIKKWNWYNYGELMRDMCYVYETPKPDAQRD